MRQILTFGILLILFLPVRMAATHIVGGEINYRCLGNDDYEIYMTVYRDCINGVPYFDTPAAIGVFDVNNNLVYDLRVPLMADDTLPGFLNDPCFVVPPVACVHRATYIDTVSLPFIPGGYQFSHQRCCRNGTILNIVEPDSTGITLHSTITEDGLLGCNNSAYFKNWPPIYICAGLPIIFDHSTIDIDGDSVVYKMCAPFDGAESFGAYNCTPQPCGVRPQPPFNPAYDSVQYVSPPFGTANMLGGTALAVDFDSGLMTGTPCCVGQYVVGVCAEEYRNGVLISTTKRDFQYNIGNCQLQIVSSFFTPEIICSNDIFSVNFDNQSQGSNVFQWDFGDPTTNGDTSALSNPSYIYPDTGRYEVVLITGPGQQCSDTSTQIVYLQYESLDVDFTVEYENCEDSIVIDFIDISTDDISIIEEWYWDFGNGDTSTMQNPIIVYDTPGSYTIELVVTAANGCTSTATEVIEFGQPVIIQVDSLTLCTQAAPIELNPTGNPNYEYDWMPPTGLSDPTSFNPIASPTQTTTYTAFVSTINPFDTCTVEQEITVVVPPPLSIDAGLDATTCIPSYLLQANELNSSLVVWSDDPSFANVLNPAGNLDVPVTLTEGSNIFYVRAYDEFGCFLEDEVEIIYPEVEITAEDVLVCRGDTVSLEAINLNPSDQLTYIWTPNLGIITGQNTSTITIAPTVTTNYWVTATNQYGCVDSVQVGVDVSSLAPPLELTVDQNNIYPGETVQLMGTLDPDYTYEWTPDPSLTAIDIYNPQASPLETTTYELFIMDEFGCANVDTITVFVRAFICDEPYIFVPNAFTPNGDGANDVLFVRANAVTEVYFAVYSRWGELMFETTDLTIGWDGTFKGKELSPDVYAFYLKLRCLNNEEYFKKGNVTLLR